MISRILAPMDDSEMSEQAFKYALRTHAGADIAILHIIGEPSPVIGKAMGLVLESDIEQAAEEYASGVLQHVHDIAD